MKTPILAACVLLLGAASAFTAEATDNPSAQIDRILEKSWKEADIRGNPMASDEVFVRRIYLDAIGRIPTLAECQEFLESTDANKRSKLIQQLLNSEGYVNHYINFWSDILRIDGAKGGGRNVVPFYLNFIRKSLREDKPYDQFVRELLTAKGQATENGAVGYTWRDAGMPLDHMANTIRVFLGTRLECAQCHNHPFDRWTQMDFYHMAAFSYGMSTLNGRTYGDDIDFQQRHFPELADGDANMRLQLKGAIQQISSPIRTDPAVFYDELKQPQLPHDYQYEDAEPEQKIGPATMFGDRPEVGANSGRVGAYADWMTSPENPRFTKVIANRLWKECFGLGLIEPVDEMMASTVSANPELMAFLEDFMIENGYSIKTYLSAIFNSKAYQREATEIEIEFGADYDFTGPLLRRMTAEQVWDSLVALINPRPELFNWKAEQRNLLRMEWQRQLRQAINSVPEEKMLEYTVEIAKYQTELADETRHLPEKIAKLREQGKDKEADELSREASQTRVKVRARVQELVYEPILKKYEFEPTLYRLPDGQKMEMTTAMVDVIGGNGGNEKFREEQAKAEAVMVEREMDELGLETEIDRRRYVSFRGSASRYQRAVHQRFPALPGHFLRQFGQSDREMIENASNDSSVPQALNLMNGNHFTQIAGSASMLTWNLRQVESIEGKIDTVFMSILTRKPTAREQQLLMAAAEARGEKIVQDTVFALLNNQEFLFVQ